MRERAELVWNGLLDLLYPPACLVCGVAMESGAMCAVCLRDMQPVQPPFCDRCGVPVPAERRVCASCENGPEPPYTWSQAMGHYGGTLLRAIHRFKYEGKSALALPLGTLLAHSLDSPPSPLLAAEPSGFDAVVPVPLHPSRLRYRGFNQAERLARIVAQKRGWRLDTDGVRRTRRTTSQTNLTREARAVNVRGAFAAQEPQRYHNQRVLIVDDVLTTMATTGEVARVVQEAGAKRVCVVALARGG